MGGVGASLLESVLSDSVGEGVVFLSCWVVYSGGLCCGGIIV